MQILRFVEHTPFYLLAPKRGTRHRLPSLESSRLWQLGIPRVVGHIWLLINVQMLKILLDTRTLKVLNYLNDLIGSQAAAFQLLWSFLEWHWKVLLFASQSVESRTNEIVLVLGRFHLLMAQLAACLNIRCYTLRLSLWVKLIPKLIKLVGMERVAVVRIFRWLVIYDRDVIDLHYSLWRLNLDGLLVWYDLSWWLWTIVFQQLIWLYFNIYLLILVHLHLRLIDYKIQRLLVTDLLAYRIVLRLFLFFQRVIHGSFLITLDRMNFLLAIRTPHIHLIRVRTGARKRRVTHFLALEVHNLWWCLTSQCLVTSALLSLSSKCCVLLDWICWGMGFLYRLVA